MKKKNILLMIIAVLVLISATAAKGKVISHVDRNPLDRIEQFSNALTNHQAKVTSWTVYAREERAAVVSNEEWTQLVKKLKKANSQLNWQPLKTEKQVMGWQGDAQLANGLKTKLSYFAYPSGKGFRTAIAYEADGKSFNRNLWLVQKRDIRRNLDRIFHGQEQIFSCVKADSGVKIKSGLINQGETYLKLFSAAPIERLDEKTFVSISAYTKTWNDSIISGKKTMNLQVALRQDAGRTVITLGTPIITQEY